MGNKQLIIWDLCGGSQNSVYHALKDDDRFKVITFDIVPPQHENQYVLDLTNFSDVNRLYVEFEKPDIIVASPLSRSFSFILNTKNKYHNERLAWKFNGDKYVIRDKDEIVELSKQSGFLRWSAKYPERIIERAKTGDYLLLSVLYIITKFNPKCWYIENPEQSLMWDFIDKNYPYFSTGKTLIKNNCYYYNYDDNFTKKPTTFLSNIDLNLKRETIKNPKFKKDKDKSSRSKTNLYVDGKKQGLEETCAKVKIPKQLLVDIFDKFYEKITE